jgi:uridine kinase
VIKLLKNGKPAYIPSHKFTEKFDRKIEPHKLVIIGGHLLFVDKRLNQLFDKKIWMDVSDLNLLYRRLKKFNVFNNSNKKTYKKYFGEVSQLDYTVKVVIPESKRYENIQRKAADFVVDGNLPPKKLLANVEKLIKISFKDV